MIFNYQAQTDDGKITAGSIEAASEKLAADSLRDNGLTVISLAAIKESVSGKKLSLSIFDTVKRKDIVIFSRQLAVMMSAMVPIVQALRILVVQTRSARLKEVLSEVADEVEGGSKFSSALARTPKIFSQFYISMVKTGEASGKLDEILSYLADQEEKDYDLMSKIKGAMIYPAFITSGLLVVGVGMMIFVVPKLTDILKESGGQLPLATRMLMGTSGFLTQYWWLLLTIIAAAIAFFKIATRAAAFRLAVDLFKIKMPIFGKIFQLIYLVRFCRSLSTLIIGGVALPRALEIVGEVITNKQFKDLVQKVNKEVKDGNTMASVLTQSSVMPPMLSQMIGVGEQTGRVDEILSRLGDFYARELDNMVGNIVTLIEPLIMVVMGIGVGIMVAAILMPMYNMASNF